MMRKHIIILLIIISCVVSGCTNQDKVILDCTSTSKESNEHINIKFYESNMAKRKVTIKIDSQMSNEEIKKQSDSLKQNYCNNMVEEDYSCEVKNNKNNIILIEKANSKVIMGEVKELSINKYKKNLEKKGFNCKIID